MVSEERWGRKSYVSSQAFSKHIFDFFKCIFLRTRGWFHQHFKLSLLHAQIPKEQLSYQCLFAFLRSVRAKGVGEIDLRGQFYQLAFAKLLCAQIPNVQKDSQFINVFLCFWDLWVQKLYVKCLWNWLKGPIWSTCLSAATMRIDPKTAKRQSSHQSFYAFGIFARKSCL